MPQTAKNQDCPMYPVLITVESWLPGVFGTNKFFFAN